MNSCPSDTDLETLLSADCTDTDRQLLEDHVDACEICQRRLADSTSVGWRRLLDTDAPAPAADVPADGRPRVPGYTLLNEIGRGGMGVVYQARHQTLNRTVALKLLAGPATQQPERWLRFRTEAQAIARLNHEHIIQVFDSGETADVVYVAQELAAGGSLQTRIAGAPQPPQEVARLVRSLTDAVRHAHDHDVLHRDIKPSNVLFLDNRVKLADFGLAKLLDAESALTETQAVIGTPAYMSPEQARGDKDQIGPATDLFALGILTYEMLTGRSPFQAETPIQTLRLVLEHDPVAPSRLQPDIPRDLETICLKCLEKTPRERYPTAAALTADLDRFLDGRPITARPTPLLRRLGKWCRRHPTLASLVVVSVAAVAVLLSMWVRFTSDLAEQTRIARTRKKQAELSLAEEIESNAASREVLEFLTTGLFDAAIPDNEGADLRVVDALANAERGIETRFEGRPKVEAAIRASIGSSYSELGLPLRALPHLQRAVDLYQELNDPHLDDMEVQALHALSVCLKAMNRNDEARRIVEALLQRRTDPSTKKNLELRMTRSDLMLRDGELESGLTFLESLLSDCVDTLGPEDTLTLVVKGQIAVARFRHGEADEAIRLLQEQLPIVRRVLGDEHPETAAHINNLAVILVRRGRLDDAEALHRENLANKIRANGAEHYSTLGSKNNLAMVVWRQGRHREATDLLSEVIVAKSDTLGPTDRRTLETAYQLGRMFLEMQAYSDGLAIFADHVDPVMHDEGATTGQWASLLTVYAELRWRHQSDREAVQPLLARAREILADPTARNDSRVKALENVETLLEQH